MWYSIKSVYDFIKESGGKIIIIEGSTKYCQTAGGDGLSTDKTQNIIEEFIKDSEDGFIIYKRLGRVEDKRVLRNEYLSIIKGLSEKEQPDWVLVIDDDECYKIEDLRRLDKFLLDNPNFVYIYNPQRWFWKDFRTEAYSDEEKCLEQIKSGKRDNKIFFDAVGNRIRIGQYHERIFKWNKNLRYTHSHSTVCDSAGRDVFIDPYYENKRIVFYGCPRYHYGYLTTTKNMYERFRYYEQRDALKIIKEQDKVWNDNYGHFLIYEKPKNIVTRTKEFLGEHPEIVKGHPYYKKGICPMAEDAINFKSDSLEYSSKEEFVKIKKKIKQLEKVGISWYNEEQCEELLREGKRLAKNNSLPKIVYCFMTLNRYDEMVKAVNRVYNYVDRIVAVDGGSVDNTIEWLQDKEKVDIIRRKWDDNFSEQRNQYVNYVLKNYPDHWVLVSDTDEHYSKELVSNLKYILLAAEQRGFNRLGFLCWFKLVASRDSYKEYEKPVNLQLKQKSLHQIFFKKLCYRVSEGVRYVKSPHEGLLGNWSVLNLGYSKWFFEHVKTRKSEVERGCRNYFIAGPSMTKPQKWQEFCKMVEGYGWKLWSDMNSAMVEGNLPEDVLKWIWSRKEWQEDGPPSSEQREFWIYYYEFLHPEQLEKHREKYEQYIIPVEK